MVEDKDTGLSALPENNKRLLQVADILAKYGIGFETDESVQVDCSKLESRGYPSRKRELPYCIY